MGNINRKQNKLPGEPTIQSSVNLTRNTIKEAWLGWGTGRISVYRDPKILFWLNLNEKEEDIPSKDDHLVQDRMIMNDANVRFLQFSARCSSGGPSRLIQNKTTSWFQHPTFPPYCSSVTFGVGRAKGKCLKRKSLI